MKNAILVCVLLIGFVSIVYSEGSENNDAELFQMKYRQVEDDDQPISSESSSDDEEVERYRRQSARCEPCGKLRRSCCFPDLCKHRPKQISKCLKVNG